MLIKVMTFALIGVSTVLFAEVQIQNRCPLVKIVNHTKKWTHDDQRVLSKARKRCSEIYLDAPCLKRFDKLADLRYTALCGN